MSACEFDCMQFKLDNSQFWWGREAKYGWSRAVCYIPSDLEMLWVLMAPWVLIQWQCLALHIVECLIHCMPSVWCHMGRACSWLAIPNHMSGKQFGKDAKLHNITTCSSVDFPSEAFRVDLVLFQQTWWQLPKLQWVHQCWLQWCWCVLGH